MANVLMLCAASPDPFGLGGVQIHTADLARSSPEETKVYTAHLDGDELTVEAWQPKRRTIAQFEVGVPPEDPLGTWASLQKALVATVVSLEVDVVHIHSPTMAPDAIRHAVEETGVRSALTLHNHSLVCPNYELLEAGRSYCGVPKEMSRCDRCLNQTRGLGAEYLERWRATNQQLLRSVDRVVTPSASVLEHAARVFPKIEKASVQVEWGVPSRRAHPAVPPSGPLRIAVVGLLSVGKGGDRLPELLRACRGLDVEWHFFGATEGRSTRTVRHSADRVVVHGAYQRDELGDRLVAAGCQLAVLPSIVPESFSLTLSEVFAAGLPAAVSDLGALAERVRSTQAGWTFDPWKPETFRDTVARLTTDREAVAQATERAQQLTLSTQTEMAVKHAELWNQLAALGAKKTAKAPDWGAARRAYSDGAARAAVGRRSQLSALTESIRRTNWYRDLPLRRLMSEDARRSAERFLRRVVRRAGRR